MIDRLLDKIGRTVDEITDLDRIERLLEMAVRLVEAHSKIKGP